MNNTPITAFALPQNDSYGLRRPAQQHAPINQSNGHTLLSTMSLLFLHHHDENPLPSQYKENNRCRKTSFCSVEIDSIPNT